MDDVGTRPHGRRSTYWRGCRCLACRAANAEYQARRRAHLARGRALPGVAVQGHDTARLIRSLLAEGFPARRLGPLVGVHERTIRAHTGSRPVERRVAARVRWLWLMFQGQAGAESSCARVHSAAP